MIHLLLAAIAVTVTAYAPSAGGLNCAADCALTASGLAPQPGMAACGPGWALGDVLEVAGHGRVVCADRGPGVTGDDVEILFAREQSALDWGVQERAVRRVARGGSGGIERWLAALDRGDRAVRRPDGAGFAEE
jgi:3D (Asp-Asp-Asp) domain-containing protein